MKIINGNIFNSKCQVLVNSVNCVGVMGKGLALECHLRFGNDYFNKYKEDCESLKIKPGVLTIWKVEKLWWNKNIKYVVNFPSKKHWRDPSKIEYIESTLKELPNFIKINNIKSMAFPLLGTNLGGLDEKLVIKVMEKHLTRMDIKYEVYRFNPEVSEPIFEKFKEGFMNTNIVFYAKSLGISKRAAVNIQNELKSGNLHSISDIIKLEMCGKTVLEKIYNYVLNDNNDLLKYMD